MKFKFKFKLSVNQLKTNESKKEFIEKSYYLDEKIEKCEIKNQIIYFFLTKQSIVRK